MKRFGATSRRGVTIFTAPLVFRHDALGQNRFGVVAFVGDVRLVRLRDRERLRRLRQNHRRLLFERNHQRASISALPGWSVWTEVNGFVVEGSIG